MIEMKRCFFLKNIYFKPLILSIILHNMIKKGE